MLLDKGHESLPEQLDGVVALVSSVDENDACPERRLIVNLKSSVGKLALIPMGHIVACAVNSGLSIIGTRR